MCYKSNVSKIFLLEGVKIANRERNPRQYITQTEIEDFRVVHMQDKGSENAIRPKFTDNVQKQVRKCF